MDRKTQTFVIEHEVMETLLCAIVVAKFNRETDLASAARRAFRACQRGDIRDLDSDARYALDNALDGAFVSDSGSSVEDIEDYEVIDYVDAEIAEAAE